MANADRVATLDTHRTVARIKYAPNVMYPVLHALITEPAVIEPSVLLAPNHMISDTPLSSSV
jgi:hypothetical protein